MNKFIREKLDFFVSLFVCICVSLLVGTVAMAASLDDIQILKISAQDQRAVIRTSDGKTQIIKPGDSLGANGKVTEIVADRVVVEEKKGNVAEKVIIRLSDGKQKVERLKKTGEHAPTMLAPAKRDVKAKTRGNSFY
jgi:hypothetical protein